MESIPQQGWLRRAIEGEHPRGGQAVPNAPAAQQAGQQVSQQTSQQAQGQKPSQGNPARALATLQEIGRQAEPFLAQQLESIKNTVMANGVPEDTARRLAVEIMGAWVGAAARGQTSNIASAIAGSRRIQLILGNIAG